MKNLFSDMNFEHSRIQVLPDESERVVEYAGQFVYRGCEFELYYSTSWDLGGEITDFETIGVDSEYSITLRNELSLLPMTAKDFRLDLGYSIDLALEGDRALVFTSRRGYFDQTKFADEFAELLDTFLLVFQKALFRSQGYRKLVAWAEAQMTDKTSPEEALNIWRQNFQSSPFAELKVPWLLTQVLDSLRNEIFGAGLLEHLLADPTIYEIQINSPKNIWIEASGVLGRTQLAFADHASMEKALIRLKNKYGILELKKDESHAPTLFLELRNERVGTYVHFDAGTPFESAVIMVSPLARRRVSLSQMLEWRMFDERGLALIKKVIREEKSILVSGKLGSGRSTVVGAMSLEAKEVWAHRRCLHIDASPYDSFENDDENYVFRPFVDWMTEDARASVLKSMAAVRPDIAVIDEAREEELQKLSRSIVSANVLSFIGVTAESIEALPQNSDIALVLETRRLADGTRKVVKFSSASKDGTVKVLGEFRENSVNSDQRIIGDWHWTEVES